MTGSIDPDERGFVLRMTGADKSMVLSLQSGGRGSSSRSRRVRTGGSSVSRLDGERQASEAVKRLGPLQEVCPV